MKTIRQVKTVFIIFIAFVCCWSPYIVVLLYDTSHSLPLPVHLYASMLAHLHASLNFAIYGLINLRSGYAAQLWVCCCRRVTSRSAAAAASVTAAAARSGCRAQHASGIGAGRRTGVELSRSFVAVEYHQLQETDCNRLRCVQPQFSTCMTDEHEYHSTIIH